jgi:hypothetical protein
LGKSNFIKPKFVLGFIVQATRQAGKVISCAYEEERESPLSEEGGYRRLWELSK